MKKFFALLLAIAGSTMVRAQVDSMGELLNKGQMGELKKSLMSHVRTMDKNRWLYLQCFVDNAFGHFERSYMESQALLKNHASNFSDAELARIAVLNYYNYFNSYQYKAAGDHALEVKKKYAKVLTADDTVMLNNAIALCEQLKGVAKATSTKTADVKLEFARKEGNLVTIPMSFGTKETTVALHPEDGFSTISLSEAKKLGLKMIAETGSDKTKKLPKYAVADTITIGGKVTLKNVLFSLVPDPTTTGAKPEMAALGTNALRLLGEFIVNRDGTVAILQKADRAPYKNYFADCNTQKLLVADEDGKEFFMDFGLRLSPTGMNGKFWKNNEDLLKSKGQKCKNLNISGKKDEDYCRMLDYKVRVGITLIGLPGMEVYKRSPFMASGGNWESNGYLGTDVYEHFTTLKINYEEAFVEYK